MDRLNSSGTGSRVLTTEDPAATTLSLKKSVSRGSFPSRRTWKHEHKHQHIPVEFNERRLGEDVEVALEFLKGLDNGWGAVWASNLGRQRHNVLGLLLLRFGLEVPGLDLDVVGVLSVKRQDIDMGVLEQLVAGVLGEDLTQMRLILAIRLQNLHHGRLWVLANVLDKAGQRHREGWGRLGCHGGRPAPGAESGNSGRRSLGKRLEKQKRCC